MLRFLTALLYTTQVASGAVAISNVIGCLSHSNVPQYLPGTSNFTQGIIPFNIRLNFTPVALAIPTTVPQIQAAVRCASKFGINVNPRSGGHSYASHSIGGEDGHLVVDLKYFDEVTLDGSTHLATVGPGTRLGNLAIALYNQGGRAIAHGVCPGVGVGGHVLHGGQGYSSHTYGLAVDFIESVEIVLANSMVVTASETQNKDLFWAIRGAGMSYGIITSFKFRTIAAPDQNVLFYYPYLWSETQATPGWIAFQDFCAGRTTPEIPAELNIRVTVSYLAAADIMFFLFEGVYHGSQDFFLAAIQPLLDALNVVGGLYGDLVVVQTVGWLDSLLFANNNDLFANTGTGEPLEVPFNYSAHGNFFTKSLMTKDLTPAGVDAFLTRLYKTGPTSPVPWYLIIAAQGGPTSVVPQVPNDATSYAHRDQIFEWQFVSQVASGDYPNEAGIAWLNPFVTDIEAAEKNLTLGMYYNYADPSLSSHQAHKHYWLDNYPRLAKIKKEVDPGLLFMNPQTVGTHETPGCNAEF